MNEVEKQREYYKDTAGTYDDSFCNDQNDEHYIAAATLSGFLNHYGIRSVLDVGCGTGRTILYLQSRHPDVSFIGIEPVRELREEAIRKGIDSSKIIEGNALDLNFRDSEFDCVTMSGVLHHLPDPEQAIKEALRVSKKIVLISDHNIYGMGNWMTKTIKQIFRDLHLRKILGMIMTKGKGYHDTDFDGVFYPFSLIDYVPVIQDEVKDLYCFSTKTPAVNLYRGASHLAILGVKELN